METGRGDDTGGEDWLHSCHHKGVIPERDAHPLWSTKSVLVGAPYGNLPYPELCPALSQNLLDGTGLKPWSEFQLNMPRVLQLAILVLNFRLVLERATREAVKAELHDFLWTEATDVPVESYAAIGGEAKTDFRGILILMPDKEAVIEEIRIAFGENAYPGDGFLQGSFEGCEPAEVIAPFKGRADWQNIDSVLLDGCYEALSFFSEAGLRFFLPAYLIADVREELQTAEPLFVLVHGFCDVSITQQTNTAVFIRKTGKTAFVNPRRYGGMTFYDYACCRLSVFTREEAGAIVTYLRYKSEADPYHVQGEAIEAALREYWLERAKSAPSAESLKQHLQEEAAYLAALRPDGGGDR